VGRGLVALDMLRGNSSQVIQGSELGYRKEKSYIRVIKQKSFVLDEKKICKHAICSL